MKNFVSSITTLNDILAVRIHLSSVSQVTTLNNTSTPTNSWPTDTNLRGVIFQKFCNAINNYQRYLNNLHYQKLIKVFCFSYIELYGLKFSKEDHVLFVQIIYDVLTLPDLPFNVFIEVYPTLRKLLRYRFRITRNIYNTFQSLLESVSSSCNSGAWSYYRHLKYINSSWNYDTNVWVYYNSNPSVPVAT